jgi:hypothetical protein
MLACPLQILRVSSIGSVLLLGACFDPDPTPLETESAGTTEGTTMGGMVCEPGQVQDCVCENDSAGTQTCRADGSGFGACDCEGADSTTTIDPTSTTEPPPPECDEDADCAGMAEGECQEGVCNRDGMCEVQLLPEGTACGDDGQTACSGADACDAAGQCSANDAPDGTPCTECALGVCACTAGACGDCAAFAPENNFVTARSIAGWALTGGWGLYREAPQSHNAGPIAFGGQVFGTDGNRSTPYPGGQVENSTARSGVMILPATLEFLSWNVDEGGGSFDNKFVRVSNDGGTTFVTLADCQANPGAQPFCQARDESRAPDDWDAISIPVPPELVGDVGIVEFAYDTGDSCCSFERGWFIDVTNFATECACAGDDSCEGLGSECGAAVCGGSGECELDAVAAGTDCGDATAVECNAPDACDGLGYCAPNLVANGLTECLDCPAGPGACNACQEGVCVDCIGLAPTNDFGVGETAFAGWVIEDLSGTGADWRIYGAAPQSQLAGSMPTNLSFAPSFGTDGNRQEPYPGLELEHSRITTTPDLVPAQLTFSSWHVDEGTTDNKIIELSVDGGASWTTLVNCIIGVGTPQIFCSQRNDPRLGTDWDNIVINVPPALVGQVGRLRFTYNTQDACCNFERGWFIDNLGFAQYCTDFPFPM